MQSTSALYESTVPSARTLESRFSRVIAGISEALKGYRQRREIAQAQYRLLGMSDRELKDIGLTRSQVYSAVHGVEGPGGDA